MTKRTILKIADIESNKAYRKTNDTTQVLMPERTRDYPVSTRLTHQNDVRTSSKCIAISINAHSYTSDAAEVASLVHDIGHSAFGHSGSRFLNKYIKEKGIKEGFCDNNNNLIVIKKNQIMLDDYDLASIIKNPKGLYSFQKEQYLYLLARAIEEDVKRYENKIKITSQPKRTLACEIMDEADRNAYVCSDLTDYFSLELKNENIIEELYHSGEFFSQDIKQFLTLLIMAIKEKDKSLISKTFKDLRNLLNFNYYLGEDLLLKARDEELILLREKLYDIEKNFFFDSQYDLKAKTENLHKFEFYLDAIFNNDYMPSNTYRRLIKDTSSKKEILKLKRDMAAEATDWFVINYFEKNS